MKPPRAHARAFLILGLAGGLLSAAALALWRARAPAEVVLASYSTSLAGRTPNQAANIRVAAHRVDGVTLQPGEEFSFGRAVGPVSPETGFVKGLALRGGEPASVDGGGICQLASTLYNAALLADFKIVERRKHLFPVHSVPPGLDATFASGSVDLRFRNTLAQPVRLRVTADNRRLTVRLLGSRPGLRQVEVVRALGAVLPPERVVRGSALLKRGQRRIVNQGRPGIEVEVWRESRLGSQRRRERISADRYAPVNEVIWVGTR